MEAPGGSGNPQAALGGAKGLWAAGAQAWMGECEGAGAAPPHRPRGGLIRNLRSERQFVSPRGAVWEGTCGPKGSLAWYLRSDRRFGMALAVRQAVWRPSQTWLQRNLRSDRQFV